jgi:hypothetical protein
VLDTSFPRPVGDVANPGTWPFPVLRHTVPGATARRIVNGDATALEGFVTGCHRLAEQGAVGVITSCGFLAVQQQALARRSPIPVASSALLLLPLITRCLPGETRVGVITYDAAALTPAHFHAAGADPATPTAGLPPGGAFHRMIEHAGPYDHAALEAELLETASRLQRDHANLGALLLECTNLPPFAAALRRATGLAVHDIVTLGTWFHAGLTQRCFT